MSSLCLKLQVYFPSNFTSNCTNLLIAFGMIPTGICLPSSRDTLHSNWLASHYFFLFSFYHCDYSLSGCWNSSSLSPSLHSLPGFLHQVHQSFLFVWLLYMMAIGHPCLPPRPFSLLSFRSCFLISLSRCFHETLKLTCFMDGKIPLIF